MENNIPVFMSALPTDPFVNISWKIATENIDPSKLHQLDKTLVDEFFDGDSEHFSAEHEGLSNRYVDITILNSDFDDAISCTIKWLKTFSNYLIYIANKFDLNYQLIINYRIRNGTLKGPHLILPTSVLEVLNELNAQVLLTAGTDEI